MVTTPKTSQSKIIIGLPSLDRASLCIFLADTFVVLYIAQIEADKKSKLRARKQLFLAPLLEMG